MPHDFTTLRRMLRGYGIEEAQIHSVVVAPYGSGVFPEDDRADWNADFGGLGIAQGKTYRVTALPTEDSQAVTKLLDARVVNRYGSACFPPLAIYCADRIAVVSEYDGVCGLCVIFKDPDRQAQQKFSYA